MRVYTECRCIDYLAVNMEWVTIVRIITKLEITFGTEKELVEYF